MTPGEIASGIVLGALAIIVLRGVREHQGQGPSPHEAPETTATPAGVLATAYRHCPAEQGDHVAVIHTDGTALCLDCGTHIPAQEATDA